MLLSAWALKASSWLIIVLGVAAAASFLMFGRRTVADAGVINAVRPGVLLSVARYLRTSMAAVMIYRWFARVVVPAIFLFACTAGVLAWAHHVSFDLLNTVGVFCKPSSTLDSSLPEADSDGKEIVFDTRSLCQATGLKLVEGRRYRITVTIEDDWFDKAIWTDVSGLPTAHLNYYLALPLKRWWTKNWFQPIARVRSVGNFEYPLEPAAPLPDAQLYNCSSPLAATTTFFEAIRTIPKPATNDERALVKVCGGRKLRPAQTLIADITPQSGGELFLYVNDAVLLWPRRTNLFYRNNSGTATVKVMPVLADAIVSDSLKE